MRRQKSVETERVPFAFGKGGPFIQPRMDEEVVSGEAYFHGLLCLEFEQECRVLAITLKTARVLRALSVKPRLRGSFALAPAVAGTN
jgi:hypothetical protein